MQILQNLPHENIAFRPLKDKKNAPGRGVISEDFFVVFCKMAHYSLGTPISPSSSNLSIFCVSKYLRIFWLSFILCRTMMLYFI